MTTRREQLAAYGSWAAVCFFWGTTYLAIRIGLETLPPALFAGLRFLTAGLVLFTFMRFVRGARLPRGREWFDLSVVGVALLGVGNGMVVWAEKWLPSGMAALLVATSPFWVMAFERRREDGERASARVLAGMLLGFAGLALLVGPELLHSSLSGYYILGMVALQVGCASWSGGSVYAKHHETKVQPMMAAAVQMLVAGLTLALLGLALGEWRDFRFSARSAAAFSYLVLFGSIIAYGAYTYAIQKLPLSVVSTYSYINPIIAVLLGWAVLSEPLGPRVLAAMLIILGGVALVKASFGASSRRKIVNTRATEAREEMLQPAPEACSAGD